MKHRRAQFIILGLLSALCVNAVSARAQQQETPPAPATPREVKFPRPVEKRLRNNLRVIVIERPESVPLVTMRLLVKTGSEADPAPLSGLADMTAELLTQGTARRTAPQIAEAIEALGGAIASGAGWDASLAEVEVMTSKAEPAMEILADVVRRPSFKNEEIERVRQQSLDALTVTLSQPGTLARYVAARVLFGDAPYAHPVSGTPESVARIKRDDILRLHRTFYRPDNAILVIGGNIKADVAFAMAERFFGDWPQPAAALPVSPAAPASKTRSERSGPQIVVVDKPDAGQAAVVLVRTGLRRADEEYFSGLVANSVLGGGYSARLNQEIRIKRGLSYGASSQLDVRREVGPFVAATQTKNQSGAEVAALLLDELNRLSSEPILETELTPRKAALIGNFGRALETSSGLVTFVGSLALYGLSLDEINTYIRNVQGVTAGRIQEFAKARLGAGDARVVIVGNAKEFLDEIKRKYSDVVVIPVAELDLNSATLRRAAPGATRSGSR